MRCLALVTGPGWSDAEGGSTGVGFSAAALVHSSVGGTACRTSSRYYKRHNRPRRENAAGVDFKDADKGISALFSALNTPLFNVDKRNTAVRDLYEEIDRVVPLGWKFVAAVICPSGEILFSSI